MLGRGVQSKEDVVPVLMELTVLLERWVLGKKSPKGA